MSGTTRKKKATEPTMLDEAPPPVMGHNNPPEPTPIVAPEGPTFLAWLRAKYPNVGKRLKEFESALKTYPTVIVKDEDGKNLSDLLGQISKAEKEWEAARKGEKAVWDGIGKIAHNFFIEANETLEGFDETWRPRLKVYLDKKEAEAEKARQAEIERQRIAAEQQRKEAEERALDKLYAEAVVELAEYDARKATERAEAAKREQEAAEARAAEARAEEARIAKAKKEREDRERDTNTSNLAAIAKYLAEADGLNNLAEAEETTDAESDRLRDLIVSGGLIGTLASPVAASPLLTDDQKADVGRVRASLGTLREAMAARASVAEKKRLAKLQAEEEAKQKDLAAARAEEKRLLDKAEEDRKNLIREADEAAAEAAKNVKAATGEARTADKVGQTAGKDLRQASREHKAADKTADKLEKRVDRLDRQAENAGPANVRGTLGSVTSKTGRWYHEVTDEQALRAVCGPLGEHFTSEALKGAVYQWMAAHREGFEGEEVLPAELPGVVFSWDEDIRIG